jgi:hypothetical protein
MVAYHLQLLEQIERGETAFKSESETSDDLKSFRLTILGLKNLQKSGHIEILELNEARTSTAIIKVHGSALVSITEFGKRDLAARRERRAKREK